MTWSATIHLRLPDDFHSEEDNTKSPLCGAEGRSVIDPQIVTCSECMEKGYAWTRARVEAHPELTRRCQRGEPMFFFPGWTAKGPGHIYSESGVREAQISGYCEFHFDEITSYPEDSEGPTDDD